LLRQLVWHQVNLRLFRHELNSSILNPIQTPTRAANGGFSAPKDENHIKNVMQPMKSSVRIIWTTKLLGRMSRRNENKPETMTNASPVKNDQRTPMAKIIKPTINNV
jgi:hypothetical protein